jgi:hypothetical protein
MIISILKNDKIANNHWHKWQYTSVKNWFLWFYMHGAFIVIPYCPWRWKRLRRYALFKKYPTTVSFCGHKKIISIWLTLYSQFTTLFRHFVTCFVHLKHLFILPKKCHVFTLAAFFSLLFFIFAKAPWFFSRQKHVFYTWRHIFIAIRAQI